MKNKGIIRQRMEKIVRHKSIIPSVILVLLTFSVYFLLSGDRILFYPTATVFISLLVGSVRMYKSADERIKSVATFSSRSLDIMILLGIVLTVVVSRMQPVGLPNLYYWLVVVLTFLIALGVFHNPSVISMFEIILLGIIIRSGLWYSAPVIDRDPRTHLAITKYTIETGDIIPEAIVYYHWYPTSHIISASTSLITGLTTKVAMFWSIIIPLVVTLPLIYSVSIDIANESGYTGRVVGLFAMLIICINGRIISGNPHAQTFGWAITVPTVFVLLNHERRRFKILIIILLTVLVLTHNLTPLALFCTLVVLYSSGKISESLGKADVLYKRTDQYIYILYLLATGTIYYYDIASYLSLQTNRFLSIFFYRGGIQEDVNKSVIAGGETIGFIDPLLHYGLDLLLYLLGFIVIAVIKYSAWRSGERDDFSLIWYCSIGLILGIVGVAILSGGARNTSRILGLIGILAAPILAYAVGKIAVSKPAIVLSLLLITAFPFMTAIAADNGLRNPGMSPTERSGSVRIHLSDSEYAGVKFVSGRNIKSYSDAYATLTARLDSLKDGWNGPISPIGPIAEINNKEILQNSPFLYRDQLKATAGVMYPYKCSTTYDSGGSKIIYC